MSWEQQFEQLREAYRICLRQDLETFEAAVWNALESGGRPAAFEPALRLAHRLKGGAATYGLAETSAALERIEARLARFLGAAPSDGAALRDEIEALLRSLRAGPEIRPE